MSQRAERTVRGLLAAVTATGVALIGHLLGGGQMPRLVGVAVPLAIAALISMLLIGRRLSLWRVSATVIVSQLLFHTLFVLGATGSAVQSGMDAMPGMAHEPAAGSVLVSASSMAMPAMTAGHVAAALFTIMLLWRGEATLRALAGLTRRALARIRSAQPLPVATLVLRPVGDTAAVFGSLVLGATLARRGPPAVI